MNTQFTELANELDKQSADWLQETHPAIFDALEIAVIRGAEPAEIRAFVMRWTGGERSALATRCEAAGRFLMTQKAK